MGKLRLVIFPSRDLSHALSHVKAAGHMSEGENTVHTVGFRSKQLHELLKQDGNHRYVD